MSEQETVVTSAKRQFNRNGWLLIDKATGMTSRDVLNRIQRRYRKLKTGHAGTLDPLATGLLLVACGKATKLVELTHRLDKSYEARIRLGATSPTDDADGPWAEGPKPIQTPSLEDIREMLNKQVGPVVQQMPPVYSAIQKEGKRAYDLARKGAEVKLEARPVRIDRIEILDYSWPFVDIVVDCGAGTYIRSIARDVGEALGVGGMIETLRRTRIGPFHIKNACTVEDFVDSAEPESFVVASQEALTGWARYKLNAEETLRIARGMPISVNIHETKGDEDSWREVALLDEDSQLVALARGENSMNEIILKPFRVFLDQD